MRALITDLIELPALEGETISRADLVFYDVDHSGPSFVAHVFIENPDAGPDTPQDLEHGHAGMFTVFGHNGCYGDEGHCLPDQRFTDEFDLRLPHPLAGWTRTVIATDAIQRAVDDASLTAVRLTIVPVIANDDVVSPAPAELEFSEVRLLVYED
jgi:tyrosinase